MAVVEDSIMVEFKCVEKSNVALSRMLVGVEVVAASGLVSGASFMSVIRLAYPKSLDLGLELNGGTVEDVSTA